MADTIHDVRIYGPDEVTLSDQQLIDECLTARGWAHEYRSVTSLTFRRPANLPIEAFIAFAIQLPLLRSLRCSELNDDELVKVVSSLIELTALNLEAQLTMRTFVELYGPIDEPDPGPGGDGAPASEPAVRVRPRPGSALPPRDAPGPVRPGCRHNAPETTGA